MLHKELEMFLLAYNLIRALADVEKQFRWYLAKAGIEVADRYLVTIDESINLLAHQPLAGRPRRFRSAELALELPVRKRTVSNDPKRHDQFQSHSTTLHRH